MVNFGPGLLTSVLLICAQQCNAIHRISNTAFETRGHLEKMKLLQHELKRNKELISQLTSKMGSGCGGKKAENFDTLINAVKTSKTPIGFDAGGLKFSKTIDPKEKYDICMVGAGLSGTVLAERYATVFKKRSLVMDIRTHIAGNCYDFTDPSTGILMNLYGAHLFHTNSERVWRYLQKFQSKAPWTRWDHEVKGLIEGQLLPIPPNINTINSIFGTSIRNETEMDKWLKKVQEPCPKTGCANAEQMAVSRVGRKMFDLVFKTYTKKQWDKEPKDLDALVTARIPLRNNFDPRYFGDKYQVLPKKGYTQFFVAALNNSLIDLALGVDYFKIKAQLDKQCKKLIFTGPIDKYFADSGLGKLEYRSIIFEASVIPDYGYFQAASVVNYPGAEVDFTRIVEYKHFLQQKSNYTVLVKEYSTDKGDPYYPVPNPKNHALYKKYQELAAAEEKAKNVHFVGRLASYKYFNMDAAIENALNMFDKIEKNPKMPDIDPVGAVVDKNAAKGGISDSV